MLPLLVLLATSARGFDPAAEMPQGDMDFSAHRVDAEVWGWKKDYSEMAVLGSEVRRDRESKHRGEAFMLIVSVDTNLPVQNVKVLEITQAALPHNPTPLDDVREKLWAIDFAYQNLWPKRPTKKWRPGLMHVESMWSPVEVESTICSPAVGFLMKKNGVVRYQPHHVLNTRAPCQYLRATDERLYWAKPDLAASMLRFDYSANPSNEQSIRFPIAVAWHNGRPLRIGLSLGSAPRATRARIRQALSSFGAVEILDGPSTVEQVQVLPQPSTRALGSYVALQLGALVVDEPAPEGLDLLIRGTAWDAALRHLSLTRPDAYRYRNNRRGPR